MLYKHDFGVVITKNPIASGGPTPRFRDTPLCSDPLSENPGSAPGKLCMYSLNFISSDSCVSDVNYRYTIALLFR